MLNRPVLLVLTCWCYSLLDQSVLPEIVAVRITNTDGFSDAYRTRLRSRQNDLMRALEDELLPVGKLAPLPAPEMIDVETGLEETYAPQITDYANVITNDEFALDNSFETVFRKRGGVTEKNFAGPQCSCKSEDVRETLKPFNSFFPSTVINVKCAAGGNCSGKCMALNYWITVLKRATGDEPQDPLKLMPDDLKRALKHKWVPQRINVTAACVCVTDFININN